MWARNENKVDIWQRTIPQCQGLNCNVLFFSHMKKLHFENYQNKYFLLHCMQNGSAQHLLLAVTECNSKEKETGNINRKAEKTTNIHYHTIHNE